MATSVLRAEVEMWPFHACAVNPAIIIGTVRSLWNWQWGRLYHVPQNVFLIIIIILFYFIINTLGCKDPDS